MLLHLLVALVKGLDEAMEQDGPRRGIPVSQKERVAPLVCESTKGIGSIW